MSAAFTRRVAIFIAAAAVALAQNTPRQKDFWSLQPLAKPALPSVKDTVWAATPIDRFILAKLEKQGLRPAPPADKRTLIRRANFDLIGLPPTPEEVDAFVADNSAGA